MELSGVNIAFSASRSAPWMAAAGATAVACILGACTPPEFRAVSPAELPAANSSQSQPNPQPIAGTSAPTRPQPAPQPSSPVVIAGKAPTDTPWTFHDTPGHLLTTDHYQVRTTVKDAGMLRSLPAFAERAYGTYRTGLLPMPAPDSPMETFVFGSRDQWEEYARDRLGKDAPTYIAIGKGGFTTEGNAILYDIGRFDTFTIMAHEGWHQYSQRVLKHPLPLWLEEGIACYMEAIVTPRGESATAPFRPWRNRERFGELRNAASQGRLIPLEALLDSSPEAFLKDGKERMLLYYAQVWALVHFLREGEHGRYAESLKQLLQDAVDGRISGRMANSKVFPNPRTRSNFLLSRVGKWVLMEYFNRSFADFKEQYEAFIVQVTAPGARGRIESGESPLPSPPPAAAPAAPAGTTQTQN